MQARSCLHARHGTLAMGLQGERVRSALNVGSGYNEEPSRDDNACIPLGKVLSSLASFSERSLSSLPSIQHYLGVMQCSLLRLHICAAHTREDCLVGPSFAAAASAAAAAAKLRRNCLHYTRTQAPK